MEYIGTGDSGSRFHWKRRFIRFGSKFDDVIADNRVEVTETMSTVPYSRAAYRRSGSNSRRRISAERREDMLQRLENLFLADGFLDLTIDDIAERLQCSKSTLYAVASSKEQLVIIVMKRFFREGTHRIEQRIAPIEDPRDKIATYLAAIGEEAQRRSAVCFDDLMAFEGTAELFQLNGQASASRVRELIHEGIEVGRFRQVHAEFIGEAVNLIIEGIMDRRLLERTGLSSGDAYLETSRLVLDALTNGAPAKE